MRSFLFNKGITLKMTTAVMVLTLFLGSAWAADKPEIFVQIGHTSSINAIEISPDNKFILSGSDDDSIKLWNAATGRLIRTFQDNEDVKVVAFLPGGKSFFSLNDKGNVCIWNIQTGERIKEFALGEMSGARLQAASCHGTTLRAVVGFRLYIADIETGKVNQIIETPKSAPVSGYLGFGFGFRQAIGDDGRRMLSSVKEDPAESTMTSKDKKMMFWDIATGRILATFTGHDDRVDIVILSPDDRLALSGSRDKTVRLWDLRRGKLVTTFNGHQKAIEALAFSPDRKYVLSGSNDHTMKLWDVEAEKEIGTFAHDCPVTYVRFSPDGLVAISGDDNGAIRFWDTKTGLEVKALKSHATSSYAVALSPNGNDMLTGSRDGQLRRWDAASGTLLKAISAHRDAISAVTYTPDGKFAISTSYDKTLKLWDLTDGKLQRTFSGHPGQVYKVAISPDGLHALSSAQDGDVRLWNIRSGAEIKAFKFAGSIQSIGFTADGQHLLIAHDQKKSGRTVKVLAQDGREVKNYVDVGFDRYANDGRYFLAREYKESTTPKEQKLFEPQAKENKPIHHNDRFNKRTLVDIESGKVLGGFGQSGAMIFTSTTAANNDIVLTKYRYDQDIRLWNVRSGKEIRRFPVKFGLLSYDGTKVIAPVGKTLQTFDTGTGRALATFSGSATGDISSMALSAGGGYVVTGDNTGAVQFWDVAGQSLLKTIKAETSDLIVAVAFSPDNQYAASVTRLGSAKIWGLRNGNKVSEFKTDYVLVNYEELDAGDYVDYGYGVLAFSQDSRHLACGFKLWDAASGRQALTYQTPGGPGPWITFSPDGTSLLSKNMIWDASSGRRVKRMVSMPEGVKSFYSPDGKFIYAADYEGVFYVVDPDTGRLIRKFADYLSPGSFEVSRDKKTLIAEDANSNGLTLWDLPSGKKRATIEVNQRTGTVLVSADARKAIANHWVSVRHINLADGKELAQFISFMDGEWIVITPEGYYNASPGGDKHLNVRVGEQVYGIENYREAFFRPDLVKVALSGGSLQDFRKLADVKQPPAVKIIDTPSAVNTDEVTVRLHLTEQGGGIGDIRLYLNGTAVVMDSRSVTIREKTDKAIVKTYALKLANGKNIIRAVAFNGDNSMQSNEATQEVTAAYAQASKPSLTALVIGINEFKNPKLKLQYSTADAELFANTLKAVSEGLFDKVTIKKLTKPEETTSEAIIREIKSFQSLRPDDLFVFYIASHGTVDEGEYFLITSNVGSLRTEKLKTDAISQHRLKEAIANIPATKKLIIIDT
ncbi:MAG: caspase family protein, partial [Smithellaceae bacterium]|nr:caspase family protein [Smithellaceae bacterium]